MTENLTLPDQHGRTAIVTGATRGIWKAAATRLAAAGAHVVLAVRDLEKGKAAAADMPGDTEVRPLDLADLASVHAFADDWDGPVDLLINNAGVGGSIPLRRTADGFEQMMGVNHLGHFALSVQLLGAVRGRVVTVSSQAERTARLDLDDLGWERRPYRPSRAYGDSKLANLLFTGELQRRLGAAGSAVTAHAAHPGMVATGMYDAATPTVGTRVTGALVRLLGQDTGQGALPLLHAAVADVPPDSFSGPAHLAHMRGAPVLINRSRTARDPELARRLWTLSESLTGVRSPL